MDLQKLRGEGEAPLPTFFPRQDELPVLKAQGLRAILSPLLVSGDRQL